MEDDSVIGAKRVAAASVIANTIADVAERFKEIDAGRLHREESDNVIPVKKELH